MESVVELATVEFGVKLADIPVGKFVAEKVTALAKPFRALMDTENWSAWPKSIVRAKGVPFSVNVPGRAPTQFRIALFTFNRPPVVVIPDKAGIASTDESMFNFSPEVFKLQADNMRAAAPETIGADAEVPDCRP